MSNDEAALSARRLASEEGIIFGISSSAAVVAAVRLAKKPEMLARVGYPSSEVEPHPTYGLIAA